MASSPMRTRAARRKRSSNPAKESSASAWTSLARLASGRRALMRRSMLVRMESMTVTA